MTKQKNNKRTSNFLFITLNAILFFYCLGLKAQTLTVGSGTNTSTNLPLYSYYGNNYSQTIYLNSDLTSAGATGASFIRSISYYYASSSFPESNWNKWTLYMKNSSKTLFSDVNDWESGLTQVFSGYVSITSAGQWITVTLDRPFLWDGSSNLIVGLFENAPNYNSPPAGFNATTVGNTTDLRSLLYYTDSPITNLNTPPTANFSANVFADAMFDLVPYTPCTGTPFVSNTISTNSIVCPNIGFDLSLANDNNNIAGGITYQWQSSLDSTVWNDMGSIQTNGLYSIPNISSTTFYRCIVTCTNSSLSDTTIATKVIANPFYNCYCLPETSGCFSGDAFNNITIGNSFSDSNIQCATAVGGYEDRSFIDTVNATAGKYLKFISDVQNGQNGTGVVGAWIDYDRNGLFDDSEYEKLYDINGAGIYNDSLLIPFTVASGLTKIRLKLEATSSGPINAHNSCTSPYYYGQTLDYLVNISAAPTCGGTPNAGYAISTQTLVCTNTSITLNLFGNEETSGITYQWEKSIDGTNWTSIGTTQYTVPLNVASQNEATYYRCNLTCSSSSLSATSNTVQVDQIPFINCFCTPAPISCSSTSLTSLSIANFTDTPTCEANGYTDNSSASTINLNAGDTYSFSGTIDNTWGNYAVLGFWIDYNHNALFDLSEYRTIGSVLTGSVNNNIKIPNNAIGGNTKMRILLEGFSSIPPNPEPCYSNGNGNGQYIDYFVNITPLPSCSGTPNAGNAISDETLACPNRKINLGLINYAKTNNSIYQWQYSTDNINWFNSGNEITDPEYGVTTESVTAYYRCVVTCPSSSLSSTSTPITVNQNIPTACYCIPDPMNCSTGAEFTSVNFSTLSNSSSCNYSNGYSDFTATVGTVTLTAGETYTFTTTMGKGSGLNVYAWIDFNKGGDFEDSEYFILGSNAETMDITHTITIPTSVDTGLTRLRLRTILYNSLNSGDACFTPSGGQGDKSPSSAMGAEGETEDYSIYIAPPNCSLVNTPSLVSTIVSNDSICSGAQITLDISPVMPVAVGFTYLWKSSTDGLNYSDIGTPLTSSSLSLNPTFANYFKCEIQCNSTPNITSDSVLVVISSMTSLANSTNVSCNGLADGTASISISGGFLPYTYNWTNSAATATVNNLAAGVYTCTYSDFIGCSNTETVVINEPSALLLSVLSSSNVSCFGLNNGSVNVVATGGTPNYTYLWSPGNINSSDLTSVGAGDYTCTVTDGNACTSTLTATITEPTALSAIPSQTDVTCYGGNNGIASVTANGGTAPYSYFWSNGFGSLPGNTISGNVLAQTYTCTITDANNCYLDQTVIVNQPTQITLTVTGNSLLCENTSSSYSVNASNTIGGITSYTWNSSSNAQVSNNSTFDYTASVVGTETISISITDGNGCSESSNYLVNINSSKNISGSVLTGTPSVPVNGTVILYKYEPFLTKFDTVEIVTIDAFGNYSFSPVTEGIHIVKAIPTNTNNLQITYGTSSANWKTADVINHGCNIPSVQNINILAFSTYTPGPGVLSGKIIQDDGYDKKPGRTFRPSAPGGPIGGVIVKGGKNPGGQMFVQTVSGADGTYTLSGLPLDEELFVLVDLPGLDTSSTYHKVLTIGTSTIVNLDFEVDSMFIKPIVDAVGINEINSKLHEVKVFPNPASDLVNINFKLNQRSLVKIDLINVIGQKVKTILPISEQSIDDHRLIIKTSDLPSGLYFIRLDIDGYENTIKLIVESRQ